MRNTPGGMLCAVATAEAAETVAAFAAGKAPPNSRYSRVRIGPASGFRIDHDDYTQDELRVDPFYQEFLRPAGIFWHANAVLDEHAKEQIEISFKRRQAHGPYGRSDSETLNSILPQLRAASRIARGMLEAETRGRVQILKRRGLATIELDRRGKVIGLHVDPGVLPLPFEVINRRLVAADPACQTGMEVAVGRALAGDAGEIAMAPLADPSGRHYFLQVHPLSGKARDLFLAASAVAVLIERAPPAGSTLRSAGAVASLFGLTDREAAVACLRGEGLDFPVISQMLAISPET
eukprot:gene11567-15459_t